MKFLTLQILIVAGLTAICMPGVPRPIPAIKNRRVLMVGSRVEIPCPVMRCIAGSVV